MQTAVVSARKNTTSTPKPFLKWVGGKRQLLPQLQGLLPRSFKRYVEPFVGGGAMFFHLKPEQTLLADANRELVDCYTAIRDCVDDVVEELQEHRYDKDHYYEVRARDPWEMRLPERAGRTIFLNRSGFNGLYRVNRAGRFNVPFGRYTNPLICDEVNLRGCSELLSTVQIEHSDFEQVASQAEEGDFVYFDPPYVPASPTASFTSYTPGGFGLQEQERLAELFSELASRGVQVMLSNSDTPLVRELYSGHRIESVSARRNINSKASKRGKVGEVVVMSDYETRSGRVFKFPKGRQTQLAL